MRTYISTTWGVRGDYKKLYLWQELPNFYLNLFIAFSTSLVLFILHPICKPALAHLLNEAIFHLPVPLPVPL